MVPTAAASGRFVMMMSLPADANLIYNQQIKPTHHREGKTKEVWNGSNDALVEK